MPPPQNLWVKIKALPFSFGMIVLRQRSTSWRESNAYKNCTEPAHTFQVFCFRECFFRQGEGRGGGGGRDLSPEEIPAGLPGMWQERPRV